MRAVWLIGVVGGRATVGALLMVFASGCFSPTQEQSCVPWQVDIPFTNDAGQVLVPAPFYWTSPRLNAWFDRDGRFFVDTVPAVALPDAGVFRFGGSRYEELLWNVVEGRARAQYRARLPTADGGGFDGEEAGFTLFDETAPDGRGERIFVNTTAQTLRRPELPFVDGDGRVLYSGSASLFHSEADAGVSRLTWLADGRQQEFVGGGYLVLDAWSSADGDTRVLGWTDTEMPWPQPFRDEYFLISTPTGFGPHVISPRVFATSCRRVGGRVPVEYVCAVPDGDSVRIERLDDTFQPVERLVDVPAGSNVVFTDDDRGRLNVLLELSDSTDQKVGRLVWLREGAVVAQRTSVGLQLAVARDPNGHLVFVGPNLENDGLHVQRWCVE